MSTFTVYARCNATTVGEEIETNGPDVALELFLNNHAPVTNLCHQCSDKIDSIEPVYHWVEDENGIQVYSTEDRSEQVQSALWRKLKKIAEGRGKHAEAARQMMAVVYRAR